MTKITTKMSTKAILVFNTKFQYQISLRTPAKRKSSQRKRQTEVPALSKIQILLAMIVQAAILLPMPVTGYWMMEINRNKKEQRIAKVRICTKNPLQTPR